MSHRAALVFFAFLTLAPALSHAQPAPPPAAPAPPSAAAAAPSDALPPEKLLARALAHRARSITASPPSDSRFAVARALLDQAVTLDPANGEWWRLYIEAAEIAQDKPALRRGLAAYLKCDPADDAAQLRLIDLIVDDLQTASERLTTLERFVASPQLTRALRSRVALRAATLRRDSGDLDGYAALLKQAIALDEANPDASAEAYALLRQRGGTPTEVAQALFNLVIANPVHADAHAQIAATMLACGQHRRAVEWYDSYNALWAYLGAPPPDAALAVLSDWATAMWGADRAAEALRTIDALEASLRKSGPTAQLPVPIATARVAMLVSIDNAAAADAAFSQLFDTLQKIVDANPDQPGPLAELIGACVLFNRRLDDAQALLPKLQAALKGDDATLQRLRGWLLMRQGKTAEAKQLLSPLAGRDMLADLALCLIPDHEDTAARLARLNGIFAAAPGSIIGIMAADLVRSAGGRAQVSAEALAIARLEQQVPEKIRRVATAPLQFVMVKLRSPRPQADFAQPIDLDVELVNTSGMPLSLAGGVLPTSLVLTTAMSVDKLPVSVKAVSVVNLGRRLRLDPGASVVVRTPIDGEPAAALMLSESTRNVLLRPQAILNPRAVQGGFAAGLLGVSQSDRGVVRNGWAPTATTVPATMAAVRTAGPAQRLAAAGRLIRWAPNVDAQFAAEGDRFSDELDAEIARWPAVDQAAAILFIPRDERARKLFAPTIERALKRDDLLSHQVLLTTLVSRTDDVLLFSDLRRDPGDIRTFAQHWRTVLADVAAAAEARDKARQDPPPARK